MSDYTKVFDGAAKDSGSATVLGADHDTEFDAISTAVNSKADEVASATAGNMAELTSDGNLADSGIASANLDGLTGVVQTRLDALERTAAINANYIRAGYMQVLNGSVSTSASVWNTLLGSESTWESWGPTGSGADNIWDEMDDMPSTARALICTIHILVIASASDSGLSLHAAADGITPVIDEGTKVAEAGLDADSGDSITIKTQVTIPLDSSQKFQLAKVSYGSPSSQQGNIYYQGFIEDPS